MREREREREMLYLILSILLSVIQLSFSIHTGDDDDDTFIINRVRLTKNTAKQSSVKLHAYSPELNLIHATLKFSSPVNTLHNSLFISEASLFKYTHVLQEETQKIVVTSQGERKVLSYLSLSVNETDEDLDNDGYNDKLDSLFESIRFLDMGGPQEVGYDGVLLLDAYSAIWNAYNIAIFTPHQLILHYTVGGALSDVKDVAVQEFSGVVRLQCDVTFDSDKCLTTSKGVEVNGRAFPLYRVVIDLDSEDNILPIDLYLYLYEGKTNYQVPKMRLLFPGKHQGDGGGLEQHVLTLHREFQYEMH